MSESRTFRLRVTYSLTGRLAMLSHLEVARTLERIVRRAGLPFAVTNGFSPHMKIAFGSALPVGVGGLREIYDLYLTEYISPERAMDALTASSPKDISPCACRYIEAGDASASVAYPIATYRAELSDGIDELIVPDEIKTIRKKKERTLRTGDYLRGDVSVDGAQVEFSLEALPTGSLRPDLFLGECIRQTIRAYPSYKGLYIRKITRISQSETEDLSDSR